MKIDIVSHVICSWCIVGYKQLEQALDRLDIEAQILWQPFELNLAMPPEGQNLQQHTVEKYGNWKTQSDENRQQLTSLGSSLGFTFNFSASRRIALYLIRHINFDTGPGNNPSKKEQILKLALLKAYFPKQEDVCQEAVLVLAAASVGLDSEKARLVLSEAV